MVFPKYLAILNARIMDGLYLPFSSEPMVWRDTPSASASSSCLTPLCFRISSNLFFTLHLQNVKFTFHMLIIPYAGRNVKFTFHKVWIFNHDPHTLSPSSRDQNLIQYFLPEFLWNQTIIRYTRLFQISMLNLGNEGNHGFFPCSQ